MSVLTWIGILSKAQMLVNTFPGMDDQDKLRLWVIANADNFQPVVDKTPNKIDDMVLNAIRRVALNQNAFNAIFNLMLLAYEWVPISEKEPIFGGKELDSVKGFTALLEGDEPVENPVLIISAVAIILQVIMFIRSQKKQ